MNHSRQTIILSLLLIVVFTACNQSTGDAPIPTLVTPNARATEIVLTQNAPPEGFGVVNFPLIDDQLEKLSGWRYELRMAFDGVFSRTPRQTSAVIETEVSFNQLGSARRVVLSTEGDLFGQPEPVSYEAVRLGPDTFLVRDNTCLTSDDGDFAAAADLTAGDLVGGVQEAVASGIPQQIINNEEVWRYDVLLDELVLPNIQLRENSEILSFAGELWVSPEHEVAVRYYLNVEVEDAIVFANLVENTLPVTGRVTIRYDLFGIGDVPNLSVPFGC